jgi:hypothetical protein
MNARTSFVRSVGWWSASLCCEHVTQDGSERGEFSAHSTHHRRLPQETYDELEYLLCEDSIVAPIEHPYRLPRAGLDELGFDLWRNTACHERDRNECKTEEVSTLGSATTIMLERERRAELRMVGSITFCTEPQAKHSPREPTKSFQVSGYGCNSTASWLQVQKSLRFQTRGSAKKSSARFLM